MIDLLADEDKKMEFDDWWTEWCDTQYHEDYGLDIQPHDAAESAWLEAKKEAEMLRKVNADLGIEAETAEALLVRWVAFFDTSTRSEAFKCIAEDSRRWIKAANAGGKPTA